MDRPDSLQRLQQVMQSLGRIAAEAGGLDALMRRVVDETMRFTGATGAVVEEAEDDEVVYVCVGGSIGEHLGLRLQQGTSLSGLCVRSGEAQLCRDSEADPRVNLAACRAVRARSMIVVPLPYGGRVIGVLKAASERIDAFTDVDQQVLELAAGIIGAALGRERALDDERQRRAGLERALDASEASAARLQKDALSDALTGLPNRRQFDHWLDAALAAPPAPGSAALCFIDINEFKQVNDRYGHDVGDQALRRIAECLRATAREGDRVARLAGDEFVALLGGLRQAEAHCAWFARKLLLSLGHAPLILPTGGILPLSISVGLAVFDAPDLNRATWLARADHAMYQAKRAGPNRYVIHRNGDGEAIAVG